MTECAKTLGNGWQLALNKIQKNKFGVRYVGNDNSEIPINYPVSIFLISKGNTRSSRQPYEHYKQH